MPPLPPPRPRLATHRAEPSAPALAQLFPTSASPGDLQRASHNQAAFLWHYAEQLTGRADALEHAVTALEKAVPALGDKLDKFLAEQASKELTRERKEAERRSVKFWFAWLLPVATGALGALGPKLVEWLTH